MVQSIRTKTNIDMINKKGTFTGGKKGIITEKTIGPNTNVDMLNKKCTFAGWKKGRKKNHFRGDNQTQNQ